MVEEEEVPTYLPAYKVLVWDGVPYYQAVALSSFSMCMMTNLSFWKE